MRQSHSKMVYLHSRWVSFEWFWGTGWALHSDTFPILSTHSCHLQSSCTAVSIKQHGQYYAWQEQSLPLPLKQQSCIERFKFSGFLNSMYQNVQGLELRLWTWLPHLQDWGVLEPALYLNFISHPRHHPSSLHQLLINLVVVERWFCGSYIPVALHSQTPPQESPAFWSYLWTAVLPSWWRLLVHWFWTLLCRRRQTLPFLTDPGQHSSTCVCVRGSIIIAMTFMVHLTSW